MQRLLTVLQIGHLVLKHVEIHVPVDPARLFVVHLARVDARLCLDGLITKLLLVKLVLLHQKYKVHVTQVLHLLVLILNALIRDKIVGLSQLAMNVVAWEEDELEPLIGHHVLLCAPDCQLIAIPIPINAI